MRISFLFFFLTQFWIKALAARPLVILTGATGQLGSPIATYLYPNYSLLLIGRQPQKLKILKETLTETQTLSLDYSSLEFLDAYKKFLENLNEKVHSLIILTPRPQWTSALQDTEIWQDTLLTTFSAQASLIKATIPYMEQHSSILIIAGTTSIQLQPQFGLSCILRRMWTTYAKSLSYELGPQGIRVNSLSPGIVLTPFHKEKLSERAQINSLSYEEEYRNEILSTPLRRFCETEDVAKSIEFLISPQASFISGINFILDGGFSTALH